MRSDSCYHSISFVGLPPEYSKLDILARNAASSFGSFTLLSAFVASCMASQMQINYFSDHYCGKYLGNTQVSWADSMASNGNNCYNYHSRKFSRHCGTAGLDKASARASSSTSRIATATTPRCSMAGMIPTRNGNGIASSMRTPSTPSAAILTREWLENGVLMAPQQGRMSSSCRCEREWDIKSSIALLPRASTRASDHT